MSLRDVYESGFDESTGKSTTNAVCPECDGRLVTDGGETSCVECGLVVEEERFDRGPGRSYFEADERRTGAPLTATRHDRGLSTEIGWGGDAKGNPLSGRKRRQISRLRTHHTRGRWQSKVERNISHANSEIQRLASALDLSKSVMEEACTIYRRAANEDLIKGRSLESMTAGSLYGACRCRGQPRRLSEIAEVARCSVEKATHGYRVLNRELGLGAKPMDVSVYVSRLASDVDASEVTRRRAFELAKQAEDTGVANGRSPSGVAAGCLYLAGQESGRAFTQTELADVADVTPVTIRSRYRELMDVTGDD